MRRLVILLVAALVGALTLPVALAAPAGAQTDPATAEQQFVARINDLRAAKGLGRLAVHPELVGIARAWAQKMADADEISHNPDLAKSVQADWQKLGENVGVGMTVEKLHDAFVQSPAHYRNLVDPDFTYIGVGVVLGRDGAIFTAHQFMKLRPAAEAAAQAKAAPASGAGAPGVRPAPAPAPDEAVAAAAATPPPAVVAPRQPPARLVLVLEQLRALDPR